MAKYEALPNISVNLKQIKAVDANLVIPFNATVICKAKTGPIGKFTHVTSYTDAVNTFGLGDSTTPVLYGVEQVLKTYGYVNIIRIASSEAKEATIEIKAYKEDGSEYNDEEFPDHILITGTSNYKTDIYNGDEIRLVYNDIRTRLCLKGELNGTTYTTPMEIIDLSTATSDVLERVLDKLVTNWNSLNTGITLENKFINKVGTETTLKNTDSAYGTVQLGDSGNDEEIESDEVIALFDLLEDPRIVTQDVVCVPEFRNWEVVNAGIALKNKYFYIVCATGSDLASKQDAIANYTISDKGVCYIPDSCTMADESIIVPFEVAALYAWATTFNASRYLAPAGTNRATLPLVTNVLNNLSDEDAEILYNDIISCNPVRYITNYGFTLYGQKTMNPEEVFTNRINVSGLVSYVQIEGRKLLTPYIFEYTPISTFQRVYIDIDKMLSVLVTKEVLYGDYKIICDESNNTQDTLANHELHVTIAIRPVNVTEYIVLDLTVTDDLGGEE